MEAKDTVMNDTLIRVWVLEFIQPGELDLNAKLKEFAQAQAEISFEAGRKEVVDWIKTHKKVTETDLYIGRATYKHYDIQEGALEAKLKEWGIT